MPDGSGADRVAVIEPNSMETPNDLAQNPSEDRYQGFSLSSVCWGYRDVFAQTLEGLFEQGLIGDERRQVTDAFFALMRCAEQQHFDYVLKEFLSALNPRTAWMMDLPGVFAEVTEIGRQLAESRLHHGITYFKVLGDGGFGDSPQQVRSLMTHLKRLRSVDDDLAVAFLSGYRRLVTQLDPGEVGVYIAEGLRIFQRNKGAALRFMEGTLKTSETIIRVLTQECRLADAGPSLESLLRALVGYEVEVDDLGRLDSDELIERDTRVVCMYRWLYMPARVRHFAGARENRNWYLLTGVVAAGMLALDSFPRVHGHPAYTTCADLVGHDCLRLNLFQLIEYARVLRGIRRMWPGARRLLDFGLATELEVMPPEAPADRLFFALVGGEETVPPAVRELARVADVSVNAFDTASLLTPDLAALVLDAYPGLDRIPLRTFAFLPDFLYPGTVSRPPRDALIADLKERAEGRKRDASDDPRAMQRSEKSGDSEKEKEEGADDAVDVCFLYDEWSQSENDYYPNYCHVHEKHPAPVHPLVVPQNLGDRARQVRRVFEMLRPELTREKYLPEGDRINIDLLTDYLVLRRTEVCPQVNFYEKPFRNQRDLATLVLLDVSGSTAEEPANEKTIEIEKRAALILGQGLAALDDRFAICGFSGNGRKMCEFFVFKDFDETWGQASMARVLAAHPRSSTRIGVALRHAGYRLSLVPAKQRLVILITDGKPMDTEYDPSTRYAQYDVRMACEENKRQGVHTFCVSTDENTQADMEIMFPDRRFAILKDIRYLDRVLPRLYIKLTL